MKDLYNNIEVTSILDPIAVTASATYTDIDLKGFNSACLVMNCGLDGETLGASNKFVGVLYDSADGDTYAVVETADMLDLTVTSGTIFTIDATGEDKSIYKFGYVGGKRYLELIVTVTGTVSMPMSIELVKGHPENAPVD
jgi:hypothetical protein